ncbi:hypothetical protein QZH41_006453 [Actinostola sp. cb2023]|nr:hypothetical protein QZH41_006453 [Actinostola sp. cb2023]
MPVVHRKRGNQENTEKGHTNGLKFDKKDNTRPKIDKAKSTTRSKSKDIEGVRILPRIIAAVVLIAAFVYARDAFLERYFVETGEVNFASVKDRISRRFLQVKCSDYGAEFKDCSPKKCGRVVMDDVVTLEEAVHLVKLAKKGMKYGKSSGGPTILDLHTGALTYEDKFVNIYKIAEKLGKDGLFKKEDFEIYRRVKNKVQDAISKEFNVEKSKLFLTKPTFFSRIKAKSAKTIHDEYWHKHVDKETYGSFYYTSLVYLTDFAKNFTGGRFIFVDKNSNHTIEPRTGRLSFFTSGSENVHYVEKVTKGTRFAITISFTCDKKFAIPDPNAHESVS